MSEKGPHGTLITIEGIDGSGKTTVWEHLQEQFDSDSVVFTREPTKDTWYGEVVSQSINSDHADSLAELFLYLADHAAHLHNTVQPAINNGQVVISDRYIDSRVAYQGATLTEHYPKKEHTLNTLGKIRDYHEPWTIPPDKTLYLDVDPETGAGRSGETNKFEQQSYLESVAQNYEWIIERDQGRFTRISSNQDLESVKEAATAEVESILDSR